MAPSDSFARINYKKNETGEGWSAANEFKAPSNCTAGRPKAALLFLFFGDVRCGVSHEMSWMRSLIELSQFLKVFLPTRVKWAMNSWDTSTAEVKRFARKGSVRLLWVLKTLCSVHCVFTTYFFTIY